MASSDGKVGPERKVAGKSVPVKTSVIYFCVIGTHLVPVQGKLVLLLNSKEKKVFKSFKYLIFRLQKYS